MRPPAAVVSVRPARVDEAPAVAAVQVAAWRADHVLADARLDMLDLADLTATWDLAVRAAPSPRHRVLVALEGEQVCGMAAMAPSDDPDADPDHEAELLTLHVDPEHRASGHGSRLVAAAAEIARSDGFSMLAHWVVSDDDRTRLFFTEHGFGPDGAYRELDLDGDGSVVVRQVRLHTSLEEERA
ncbi:MAG: GNAT family N-acetyltransferase [Candidatus Nanopelagicales bacterium]